jgi:hypothetical protein
LAPVNLNKQSGFTIVHFALVLALSGIAFVGWRVKEHRKERADTQRNLEKSAAKIRDLLVDALENDLAWRFTREASPNSRMNCLTDHTSCENKGGSIVVQDAYNRVIYDSTLPSVGLTASGTPCSSFQDSGSDSCPFRFEIKWEPRCLDDCVDPKLSSIHGQLHFRPGPDLNFRLDTTRFSFHVSRDNIPSEPKNCAAAYAAGNRRDGTIAIRPNPSGKLIYVHCDQNRDGGGWALVANAAEEKVADIPIAQVVVPNSSARLPTENIALLLAASSHQNENNIRILLPDIDRGLVLGLSSNGGTDIGTYTASFPDGECLAIAEKANFASKSYGNDFGIELQGQGELSFHTSFVAGKKTPGLDICFGTHPNGKDCGIGCKSLWKGVREKLRGSVWIR